MIRAVGIVLALQGASMAAVVGVEAMVVRPQFEDHEGVAFQAAAFSALPKLHGVLENGLFLKPGTGSDRIGHAEMAFGYHLGYTFLPDFPLIRPGFFGGIAYDKWVTPDGYTWTIHPNYGVKAQISILSFAFSGRGIGFGLNFRV